MAPDALAGPLQRTNLREQVLALVRQALVSGEIRPGDIYSAAALATRLGVSSSPVREAMLTLVNEGLMEPVRNRGYRVIPMSEHDLDEVYTMRLLLEVPGTLQAAANAQPEDLTRLTVIADEIEKTAREGDVVGFLEADRRFHLDLLQLCGNRRLVTTVAAMRDQTRLYGLEALAERGVLDNSAHEHHHLLEAIARNDANGLENLIRHHLLHVRSDWARPDSVSPARDRRPQEGGKHDVQGTSAMES
ncbi:GntR family transcriptional regulator [Streptomyces sp. NEAU-YJ-81]|uniref:GntR family transcriptional regulator n=1 Tax=Streptomyces sp. NEAU-YJ-81 TaxID=2820288 RepID=UPI001ABC5439|nr:GntR family transcriptional regulator [Streptomyces sp. NEAU-YJ-81]MBO3682083.1 GntR family transcriptional regulator [Streptomyces sp. NEAU-YJ-81]